MAKYLYCITKQIEPALLSITGIEEAPVHTIQWQDLSCVVSDTKFGDKGLDKDSALAHERVLEETMKHSPIVPIAFGHVARSEDEIKSKLLEANKNKLDEFLSYLKGKIELSLKAFWFDLNPVLMHIAETSSEIRKLKARGRLTRNDQMRAGEIAAKLLGKTREDTEDDIIKQFNDLSLEHKKCNLFGEQMITNIAFLINGDNLDSFDEKVNEYSDELGSNVKLKYTGPVPPYNFVDLNISLNTKT
jgi:hypothetical protein